MVWTATHGVLGCRRRTTSTSIMTTIAQKRNVDITSTDTNGHQSQCVERLRAGNAALSICFGRGLKYQQIDVHMVHMTQGPMPISRRSEFGSGNENQSKYRYWKKKKKKKMYRRPSIVLLCYYMQKYS